MNTTKAKILDAIRKNGYNRYSANTQEKAREQNAVKELETDGLITSVSKAIGKVYAKAL